MKCNRAQELFSSYLENTIQPPMGVALEQHLAECGRCKAEYGRFHATTVVLDELPEVEPPADLHAMIMARVEEARLTAPARIPWWKIDWQSAFTVRVPAKAVAGVAAALLAFVGLAQFTPIHTVTANFLGAQRAITHPADDSTTAPAPLPTGFKTDAGQYVAVGHDLSIGVRVDSTSPVSTLYVLRLATTSNMPVDLEVSMLSGSGEESAVKPLKKGTIIIDEEAAIPVEVTQSTRQHISDVAVVKWSTGGRTFQEYVFLPSAFGFAAPKASLSVSGDGSFELLNKIAAKTGSVILAPGTLTDVPAPVTINGRNAGDAVAQASNRVELSSKLVAPSVYLVK